MFDWIWTPVTCPSWLGRLSAINPIARAVISLTIMIPMIALGDAAIDEADAPVLDLAFRGYVAIVFPVDPNSACSVHPSDVVRKFHDTYRSWYTVTVNTACPNQTPEKYQIWFMCSRRNTINCSLITEPTSVGGTVQD